MGEPDAQVPEVLEAGTDRRRRPSGRVVVGALALALVLGAAGLVLDGRLRTSERIAVDRCSSGTHAAVDDAWSRVSAMVRYVRPVLDSGGPERLRRSMYRLVSSSATGSRAGLAEAVERLPRGPRVAAPRRAAPAAGGLPARARRDHRVPGQARRRRAGRRGALAHRGHRLLIRARRHSHSMVPGGFDVTSSVTRLTSATSLVIRVEMRSRTSYGSRAQSAVIASSEVTGRITTGCP